MPKSLKLLFICVFILITAKGYTQQTSKADTIAIKATKDSIQINKHIPAVPLRYQHCNARSPVVAGLLAFLFLTAGQIYNKQYSKAGAIWVVTGVTAIGIATTSLNHGFKGNRGTNAFVYLLVTNLVYAIVDAPISAIYLNKKYGLHKKNREFSFLHLEPNLINTNNGSGNS